MKYFLLLITSCLLTFNAQAKLTEITNKAGKTIKITIIACDEETVKFTMPGKSGVKSFNITDLSEETQEELKSWKSQGKEFSNDLELVSYKHNKSENKAAKNTEEPENKRKGKGNRKRNAKAAPKVKSFTVSPKLVIRNRDKYKSSATGSVYLFIYEGSNTPLRSPLVIDLDSIPPKETIEIETPSLITNSYKGYALFVTNSNYEIILEKGSMHGITKKCNETLTTLLESKRP